MGVARMRLTRAAARIDATVEAAQKEEGKAAEAAATPSGSLPGAPAPAPPPVPSPTSIGPAPGQAEIDRRARAEQLAKVVAARADFEIQESLCMVAMRPGCQKDIPPMMAKAKHKLWIIPGPTKTRGPSHASRSVPVLKAAPVTRSMMF